MIVLDATTKTIEALLGGVPSAQLPIVATYGDTTSATMAAAALACADTATNSTTPVTAVAAPASGAVRQVMSLTVNNGSDAAQTVTVRLNNNGTTRILQVVTLQVGETLTYVDAVGWRVLDSDGAVKSANIAYQTASAQLSSLANVGDGVICHTAANTVAARTITGTTNQVTVTNGNGVGGDPIISLPQNFHTAATPQFAGLGLGVAPQANGLAFPSTQAAIADANTLDDYEEGTWTPVFAVGGSSAGVTYAAGGQVGAYVKIGRLVWVSGFVYLTNNGSGTGTVWISGLPFVNENVTYQYATGGGYNANMAAGDGNLAYWIIENGTVVYPGYQASTGSTNHTDATTSNTSIFSFSICYRTTA